MTVLVVEASEPYTPHWHVVAVYADSQREQVDAFMREGKALTGDDYRVSTWIILGAP